MVKAGAAPTAGAATGGRRTRTRTGIALSMTEIRAADVRLRGSGSSTGGDWQAPLDPPDLGAGTWPTLAQALRDLSTALKSGGGSLVVALMPPLTEVRGLDLPPLKDDELHRLLSRNAVRYFLNARDTQIVGASIIKQRRNGDAPATAAVVGAAASARLVASIQNAARDAGWIVEAIAPAEAGWRNAAVTMWPMVGKGLSHLLVHTPERTDLLRLEGGQLAGVRRFRAGAADADLIADTIAQTRNNGTAPRVVAIGSRTMREELTRVLSSKGSVVLAPPANWSTTADDAALVAASFVAPNEQMALRTEAALAARVQKSRILTVYVAAAAVAFFALAAWVELWGVRRELTQVQAEHKKLAPQLEVTHEGQATFTASYGKLEELIDAERMAPHWTHVISEVNDKLASDAFLTRIATHGDTITIEAKAKDAGPIIDALSFIPGLVDVKPNGQVRTDTDRNGQSLDKFALVASRVVPVKPKPAGGASSPPRPGAPGAPARATGTVRP